MMNDDQPTQPLTDEELAAIRERESSATFGPWHPYSTDFRGMASHSVISKVGSVLAHTGYGPRGGSCHGNAEFMAEARTDIPALLAEVDRLRAENAAARELHEPVRTRWKYDHCASGCGAGPMQAPDRWPCATAKALGMDHVENARDRKEVHGE